jgi:predicted Zn-dependent protease with MMP-like domain
MVIIPKEEFEDLVNKAVAQLPKDFLAKLKNVAILVDDEPDLDQRRQLMLHPNQTLFGLYEGVPLSKRQGTVKILPDKITIFQKPLEYASYDINDLFEKIDRTVWHEVAHYFGLDHERIKELESKEKPKKL